MSDDTPEYARPIDAQVSAIRHDLAGVRTTLALLHEVQERMAARIENVENRQTLMDAQLATIAMTPEAVGLEVDAALERRAAAARAERIAEIKGAFGRAKSVALYVTAVGNAILMLGALWVLVMGNPL